MTRFPARDERSTDRGRAVSRGRNARSSRRTDEPSAVTETRAPRPSCGSPGAARTTRRELARLQRPAAGRRATSRRRRARGRDRGGGSRSGRAGVRPSRREERRRRLGLEPDAPDGDVALEEVRAARSEDREMVPLERSRRGRPARRVGAFAPLEDDARGMPAAPCATRAGTRPRRARATGGRRTCPPRCAARAAPGERSRGSRPREGSAARRREGERGRPRREPSATRTRARRRSGTRAIWSATRRLQATRTSGASRSRNLASGGRSAARRARADPTAPDRLRPGGSESACAIPFTNGRPRRSRKIRAVRRPGARAGRGAGRAGGQKPDVLGEAGGGAAAGGSPRRRASGCGERRARREDGPRHDSAAPGPRSEKAAERERRRERDRPLSPAREREDADRDAELREARTAGRDSPNVKTVTRDVEKSRSDSRGRRGQRADRGIAPREESERRRDERETEAELDPHGPARRTVRSGSRSERWRARNARPRSRLPERTSRANTFRRASTRREERGRRSRSRGCSRRS